MSKRISIGLATSLFLGAVCFAHAENVLGDPGFEDPSGGVGGVPYSYSGIGDAPSAAFDWDIENFNTGVTTTWDETPPGGLSGSGNYSLLVNSVVSGNGVGQDFVNNYQHLYVSTVSGYVYLESGSVAISIYDSSNNYSTPIILDSTSTTGRWINLSATANASNVVDFEILALSANTEFYADNFDVETPTPEPASMAVLGVGVCGLLRRKFKVARTVK